MALQFELEKAKADLKRWMDLGESLGKKGKADWAIVMERRAADIEIFESLIAEAKQKRQR
jgi:hypothetical protein